MILNDISNEYTFVSAKLNSCENYFEICQEINSYYLNSISASLSKYYKNIASTNAIGILISENTAILSKCFNLITKLNSATYNFIICLSDLKTKEYSYVYLKIAISELDKISQKLINLTNIIIETQDNKFKEQNIMVDFINCSKKLLDTYHLIRHDNFLFFGLDKELFEPLPPNIDEKELSALELRSNKSSTSLTDYAQDLSYISSFITQYEFLLRKENSLGEIYLRKFESGSLRIVWAGKTIELNGIPEIIKAITEGIRTFRLTTIEKKEREEEIRAQKLENDAKELAIINSQISTISNTLGLSKDKPEDVEKIQRLCLPLVRYINNNPVGQVGDYKYDITSEVKLLEDFYFKE